MDQEILNKLVNIFPHDENILAVYLYGSQLQKPNQFSDIDLAILFSPKILEKEYTQKQIYYFVRLSKVIDREVDIQILNSLPNFLQFEIIRMGKRIYERTDRIGRDFEAGVLIEYYDFEYTRNLLQEAVFKRYRTYGK